MRVSYHIFLALVLLTSFAAFGAVKYELPTFEMELVLKGALFQGPASSFQAQKWRPSLMLDLTQYDTRWERIWGIAREFNISLHSGRVDAATITDTDIALTLQMKIEGDSWIPGGRANYDISLKRAPDGTIAGTYVGRFKGVKFEGNAYGQVKPRPTLAPGYVPIQPGEHPRILFRKTDLPALREKAKTPLGQAALAAMGSPSAAGFSGSRCGDAIGMGVKYQLTGDAAYAEQARVSCAMHMADYSVPAFARGRQWGGRFEQIAVSYDLCYDAWPAAFRRQVEMYLRFTCGLAYRDQQKLGRSINWTVCSNYGGPIYAGTAFAGLALWGERGLAPAPPISPSEADAIAPAVDYTPGKDVPIVPLVPGVSPNRWLATPAVPFVMDADPLEDAGGVERARPEGGMTLDWDGTEVTFAPLADAYCQPGGGINLAKFQTSVGMTAVFYTVLENDRTRTVKVVNPNTRSGWPLLVLNGNVLDEGRVVELREGRYPLLVLLRLGTK